MNIASKYLQNIKVKEELFYMYISLSRSCLVVFSIYVINIIFYFICDIMYINVREYRRKTKTETQYVLDTTICKQTQIT